MALLFLDELFNLFAPCSVRITSIEDLDDNIGRIDHFVQLSPNASTLTSLEQSEHWLVRDALVVNNQISVLRGVVFLVLLSNGLSIVLIAERTIKSSCAIGKSVVKVQIPTWRSQVVNCGRFL